MPHARATIFGLMGLGLALCLAQAHADEPPRRVGDCLVTTIKEIGHRLDGVNDSGSLVAYYLRSKGVDLFQVSNDESAVVRAWRKGDAVRVCLVSLPRDCPAGDDRGKLYRTTNLRTHTSWTEANASHSCGGA
jgi:hypothetical protein